jgi:Skp family chaperone for outer membrane proteins
LAKEQQKREEKVTMERQTLAGFSPDSEEYQKRRTAFKEMMINYQAWLAVERETLKEDHFRWIERTYAAVIDGIDKVARRRGVQVVLTREELDTSVEDATVLQKQILNRKVVYYDPALDLTDEVLAVINEAFAKSGGARSIQIGP